MAINWKHKFTCTNPKKITERTVTPASAFLPPDHSHFHQYVITLLWIPSTSQTRLHTHTNTAISFPPLSDPLSLFLSVSIFTYTEANLTQILHAMIIGGWTEPRFQHKQIYDYNQCVCVCVWWLTGSWVSHNAEAHPGQGNRVKKTSFITYPSVDDIFLTENESQGNSLLWRKKLISARNYIPW